MSLVSIGEGLFGINFLGPPSEDLGIAKKNLFIFRHLINFCGILVSAMVRPRSGLTTSRLVDLAPASRELTAEGPRKIKTVPAQIKRIFFTIPDPTVTEPKYG